MTTNPARGPRGGSRRGASKATSKSEASSVGTRVEGANSSGLVLDLDVVAEVDRLADLELAGGSFKVRKSFVQRGRRWRPGEPFDTSAAKDIEVLERCGYIVREKAA